MPELILSDITVMGQGYCVIGLERLSPDSFRSVRPMPPWGFAWREPFPCRRGDVVTFQPVPTVAWKPHVEDQKSHGLSVTSRKLGQPELLECLQKAEMAPDLQNLFHCPVEAGAKGGGAVWVDPAHAQRSICGCAYNNLRFRLFPEERGFNLRAEIVLESNERVSSIPVVDREWRRFAGELVQRIRRADPLPLAERFLNRVVGLKLLAEPRSLARIGLPRPREEPRCWLMLDSLFPQPEAAWLELL
jgi:hypothetical protein